MSVSAGLLLAGESLVELVGVSGERVVGLEYREPALAVSEREQGGALRPQAADRGVDRFHEVHVERAHDGRDEPGIMAVEEVAKKAAPDVHFKQLRIRS